MLTFYSGANIFRYRATVGVVWGGTEMAGARVLQTGERLLRVTTFQPEGLSMTPLRSYLHYVTEQANFYNTRPEKPDLEAVRQYELHMLHERKPSSESVNTFVSSVQFLYTPGACKGSRRFWLVRWLKRGGDAGDEQFGKGCVVIHWFVSADLSQSMASQMAGQTQGLPPQSRCTAAGLVFPPA